MSPRRGQAISPIERRKRELEKQIETLRRQVAKKTRKDFKTEQGFLDWQRNWPLKLSELESELSILNDPGEYNEIPPAVAAEELGISVKQVLMLIASGEIQADQTNRPGKDYISREELERILGIGAGELLRLSEQHAEEIFREVVQSIHVHDLVTVERAYRRIEAREHFGGLHEVPLRMGIHLLKGELGEAHDLFQEILESDQMQRNIVLNYMGELLRQAPLSEEGPRAVAEQIIAIADGADPNPLLGYYQNNASLSTKSFDEMQGRAIYLATAIFRTLKKYHFAQRFKIYYRRESKLSDDELNRVLTNAIYTALYSETHYDSSAACRAYVNSVKALIPRRVPPPALLENLPE